MFNNLKTLPKDKMQSQAVWANQWSDMLFFIGTAIIPASLFAKSIMMLLVGFFLYALSFKLSLQAYYWATIYRLTK